MVALAVLAGAALARAEIFPHGNLRVSLDGGFSPSALPRDHLAPVKVHVKGDIKTTDGTQPPPLRELELQLNRHGRVSSRGLGVCRAGSLQSASTSEALSRCPDSVVGHGTFHASFDFSTGSLISAEGTVLVFNSRRQGRQTLLLHFYVGAPAEASLVLPLQIRHKPEGNFGIDLRTKIPKLAGRGAITGIDLTIGRTYSYRGKRRSYLMASCPAPSGFGIAPFPFLRGTFFFAGSERIHGTLTRICRVSSH